MIQKALALLLAVLLAACGSSGSSTAGSAPAASPSTPAASPAESTAGSTTANTGTVRVGLDWTPNTNHTGLYVARDNGYYGENDLAVEIIQAQEGSTVEQLVATGRLDFGISYQEGVTQARVESLPIVSVAAIIQHNTSGFASRAEDQITSPKDFEGKKYGAFGSPVEREVIKGLMDCAGADINKVEFVNIGTTDFFVATERGDVDFAWVFEGWTNQEAAERNVPLNMVSMRDQTCIPDYYTPVIITSEDLITNQPDVVQRFVQATSKGYQFAINNPDQAAEVLLRAAPELDPGLVQRSQQYLAAQYQADAPRWGEQQAEVWRAYAQWMADRQLIDAMIETDKAFTNQFLP